MCVCEGGGWHFFFCFLVVRPGAVDPMFWHTVQGGWCVRGSTLQLLGFLVHVSWSIFAEIRCISSTKNYFSPCFGCSNGIQATDHEVYFKSWTYDNLGAYRY